MSDNENENGTVHPYRRKSLPPELAAVAFEVAPDEPPLTVVNMDAQKPIALAALKRLRTRVLIPALFGAAIERLIQQARRRPGIAGAAVVSVVAASSALALAGSSQPLAAPPAVVERVTLPPLPAVTHTITATSAGKRTITLPPSTVPPSIVRLRPPPRVRTPPPTPPQARPTARPPAKPSRKPPPATSRPEIRVPETPAATPRQMEAPRPQPITQPPPRPTQRVDVEPSRTPEQTHAPEQTRTPEASQTSEPTPPPEVPTTKACGVRVDLGPLLDLCVLG